MSIPLCIIVRERAESGKQAPMSKLARYLRSRIDNGDITQVEIERRSGIPDSTLSRIISGEVDEPKASQIAQIAKALEMPFWRLMQIAGYTTSTPGDLSEEAQRLAVSLEAQPDLRALMDEASDLLPEDRDATRGYIADLQDRRLKRLQARQARKKTRPSGDTKSDDRNNRKS